MLARMFVAHLFFLTIPLPALAQINCEPLKPNPPRDVTSEVIGKIDAKISGAFSRIVSAGGSLEGTFKESSRDILNEYPNADRLYMWERILYLRCEDLRVSRYTAEERERIFNDLLSRMGALPLDKAGEGLLDPPRLVFGTPVAQFRAMMATRRPATIGNGNSAFGAAAKLLGLQGHGRYDFDLRGRLIGMSVWNTCSREKHSFPINATDVLPEWLEWRDTRSSPVRCAVILDMNAALEKQFGSAVRVQTPGDRGRSAPLEEICWDIVAHPSQPCTPRGSLSHWRLKEYVATDRTTLVVFQLRMLQTRADVQMGSHSVEKLKQTYVGVVMVAMTGTAPLEPTITYNISNQNLKYLE